MTKEQFERGLELQRQIDSINDLLPSFEERTKSFRFEPMTRQSGIYIRFGHGEHSSYVHLTEDEAECIHRALLIERARLINEFKLT